MPNDVHFKVSFFPQIVSGNNSCHLCAVLMWSSVAVNTKLVYSWQQSFVVLLACSRLLFCVGLRCCQLVLVVYRDK